MGEVCPFEKIPVPLFEGLSDEDVSLLLGCGTLRHCRLGESVFIEGEIQTSLYVVVFGEVGVYRDGRLLRVCRVGDSFGEAGVLQRETSSTSALAMTQADVFKLDGCSIRQLVERGQCSRLLLNLVQSMNRVTPPSQTRTHSEPPRPLAVSV